MPSTRVLGTLAAATAVALTSVGVAASSFADSSTTITSSSSSVTLGAQGLGSVPFPTPTFPRPPRGPAPTGTRSAAAFIAAGADRPSFGDSTAFDSNTQDFDITYNLVLAVIAAKPNSPVGVLTKGEVPLTLFLPVDGAWRGLAVRATGDPKIVANPDKVIFDAVLRLGIDEIERVLLYHVVPGVTLTVDDLRARFGTDLTTALGQTVRVAPLTPGLNDSLFVSIVDKDPESRLAILENILEGNRGNVQSVQTISSVLRPLP